MRSLREALEHLPPEWPRPLQSAIRERVAASGRTVVVLDDDPTGTQTVHDVVVLTEWTVKSLAGELAGGEPLFYVLTNSRSLPQAQAEALAVEIGKNLRTASEQTNRPLSVISRSDSTLRGHYPAEVTALEPALGLAGAVHVLAPFFEDGGRYTIDDVHYVAEGDCLVPAAETAFARDASFGYRQSNLREWVEEKTGGRVRAGAVQTLSLEEIRQGGPERVAERLAAMPPGAVCAVNAVSMRDLEVVTMAVLDREAAGQTFLFRTGASFVRARAGLPKRPELTAEELTEGESMGGGGLIVVGSHVPMSSQQLQVLMDRTDVQGVELEVGKLFEPGRRAAEVEKAIGAINRILGERSDAVLFTSREVCVGNDPEESLRLAQQVSSALVKAVRALAVRPRFLVSKGGITSSDVATAGLGVRRALVLGQILPGVPVWKIGSESRFPGMKYVVFPGNVGGPEGLFNVVRKLGGRSRELRVERRS